MDRIVLYLMGSLLIFSLLSCEKEEAPEDVLCDNAQLNICNPTSDQIVVYGWNSNQVTDTLFPGECMIKDFGYLKIEYHEDGSVKEESSIITHFYTNSGSYLIGIRDCYVQMDAPTGYINVAHCYNGLFDPQEGELDTDCGGNCEPCKSFTVPCDSMQMDRLKWSDASASIWLSSNYNHNMLDNKKIIEFTFYDGEELNVAIPSEEIPLLSERFLVGSEYYEAEVWFTDRFGNKMRTAVAGESIFFIVDENGNQFIQFCDVDFENQFGNVYQSSANLSVD